MHYQVPLQVKQGLMTPLGLYKGQAGTLKSFFLQFS